MNREELISKLSSIKVCVANITYTYDVCLFFDVLSGEGVHSEQGYNIGQWPCFKLNIPEDTSHLISRLKRGEVMTVDELLENNTIRELCTYHSYANSWLVEGDTLIKCISQVKEGLKEIEGIPNSLYAYVSLDDWNVCEAFFLTYKELQDYFLQKWNYDCKPWKDISDEELKEWYQIAEENGWEGIPYMEINGDGSK